MNDQATPTVGSPAAVTTAATETERSFPLVALMQLGAVIAAIVVCIDGPRLWELFQRIGDEPWAGDGLWIALALIATAMISSGVIGLVVGLGQRRRFRSALIGAAAGALFGLLMLAIFAAPASLERCAGGIAMVLLSTIALRASAA